MKAVSLPLFALPLCLLYLLYSPTQPAPAAAPTASETEIGYSDKATEQLVVVELFTSQGCSSCPPADKVLRELAGEDDVIALSYHVDYWNYLGWADPFSSPWYSARQRDYGEALNARTYTPQLVINGRQELVGSRREEVRSLVAAAKRTLTVQPELSISLSKNGQVTANYRLNGAVEGLRVSAAIVQKEARSSVNRGENRGRELSHVNIVRGLEHEAAGKEGSLTVGLPESMKLADAHVVLLVQKVDDQSIVGAARAELLAR